jgi:hypothetical protein
MIIDFTIGTDCRGATCPVSGEPRNAATITETEPPA